MPRGSDFERGAIAGRDIMDQLPTNRQAERQRHRKAIRRGFAHQHQLFGADGNLDRLALRQVLCSRILDDPMKLLTKGVAGSS